MREEEEGGMVAGDVVDAPDSTREKAQSEDEVGVISRAAGQFWYIFHWSRIRSRSSFL